MDNSDIAKQWTASLTVLLIGKLDLIKEGLSVVLIIATIVYTLVKTYNAVKKKGGPADE